MSGNFSIIESLHIFQSVIFILFIYFFFFFLFFARWPFFSAMHEPNATKSQGNIIVTYIIAVVRFLCRGKDWHAMRVEVFLQSAAIRILQQQLSRVSFPAGR